MKKLTFGRLLPGSPAEIRLTDEEHRAFDRAETYQSRLLIARRAAFRMRLTSMLLTDNRLVSNLNCTEPRQDEELIWLAAGQFSEALDRNPKIKLGPEAVKKLSIRGSHPKPIEADKDLLQWLDVETGTTIKELAAVLEISRSEVQKRITAMSSAGLVRRSGPASRHTPVKWFLAEDEEEAA